MRVWAQAASSRRNLSRARLRAKQGTSSRNKARTKPAGETISPRAWAEVDFGDGEAARPSRARPRGGARGRCARVVGGSAGQAGRVRDGCRRMGRRTGVHGDAGQRRRHERGLGQAGEARRGRRPRWPLGRQDWQRLVRLRRRVDRRAGSSSLLAAYSVGWIKSSWRLAEAGASVDLVEGRLAPRARRFGRGGLPPVVGGPLVGNSYSAAERRVTGALGAAWAR